MTAQTLGFALAAGLVAALNPCGFALLPGYLMLVVAGEGTAPGRLTAVGRALAATAVMAAGFVVVFGTFGLVIAPLTTSVLRYLPAVTVIVGLVLLAVGGWMLAGREITVLLPKLARGAPTARLASMFGYGVAYAIASLSCTIGPFLAVTGTTFRSGSVVGGIAAYLAYGAGMALLVGVLAVAVALAGTAVTAGVRKVLPYFTRTAGALLILTGLYVGYYGIYELRLYFADGDAHDPIIDAASKLQQGIADRVDALGAGPILVVLVVLVLAATAFGWYRARRRAAAQRDRLSAE
ncbi:cytochrome c biogenesis protein CcdA [Nocardia uniformis]|uniref:Cytochrome c biogenesis protein CcdA n=1 Tax=Nocardia uniformis TaxID=53432 RepID=A0A849BVH2_9NOCA|nr:cytochrome c biogenesis protein CcdA [Nocardia uniformis]NNH70593.1 cytochrome c biogenesis protein CcdA [Nocardia uniformis]